MARLTIVTRPSKREDDSSKPLALRISHKDSTRYIYLGIRLHETHWNASREEVRRTDHRHGTINSHLHEIKAKATAVLTEFQARPEPIRTGALKEAIRAEIEEPEETGGFISFAREKIQEYEDRGQDTTAETYRTAINKLGAFHEDTRGRKGPAFREITGTYLEEYRTWMAKERGNAQTTRSHALACLRVFWNKARKAGKADRHPFEHVDLVYDRAKKTALTREELGAFADLELEHRSRLWHVQQTFLLQVYGMGMRLADVIQLQWDSVAGGRLTYQMSKSGKEVDVKLVAGARSVLGRYEYRRGKATVLPWMDEYGSYMDARKAVPQKINGGLSKLADRAGIEKKVTSHVARHSFARIAVERGWTVRQVSAALRHSSIATTERYLEEVTSEELDRKMDDLF